MTTDDLNTALREIVKPMVSELVAEALSESKPAPEPAGLLISTADAARRLGVHERTVQRMCVKGTLPAVQVFWHVTESRIAPGVLSSDCCFQCTMGKCRCKCPRKQWCLQGVAWSGLGSRALLVYRECLARSAQALLEGHNTECTYRCVSLSAPLLMCDAHSLVGVEVTGRDS